jgi:RNA polymerase sigma factor (sigma-70 family)
MASAEEVVSVVDGHALRARFAALLAEHGAGLRRVARTYAARTDETEDLLQEIALAVWRALPSFRAECSDRTFVFRVAHNRGLTFAERGGRKARSREPLEPDEIEVPGLPTAEEHVADARRKAALWCAIHALAPGMRAVVTLALEGLSHAEIGEILGVSAGAVAVRLSRGREELRRTLLSPEVGGES